MQINFTRNIHFTRHIKTAERVREFNFRKIPDASAQLFHVDVPDDRGNRIMFRMQKLDNTIWKIIDQALPAWVWDTEKVLGDMIEEEMKLA